MRAKLLDISLTLVTLVMAGVALWFGAERELPDSLHYSLWPRPITAAPTLTLPRTEDDPVLAVPALDFRQSDRTLLIVVKSDCRFCTASKPFYADLLKHERGAGGSIRVFLVGPETDVNFTHYLSDLPFSHDRRLQVATDILGVSGTPTLLLVDQSGRIKDKWVGKLTNIDEATVINAAFSLNSAALE